MRYIKIIQQDGYIKRIDDSYRGRKPRTKESTEEKEEIIQFCLNCTKKKCKGTCNDIRELKKKYGK